MIEEFITATDAAKLLGVCRKTFYNNVVGKLPRYSVLHKKSAMYRKRDILHLLQTKVRPEDIAEGGL